MVEKKASPTVLVVGSPRVHKKRGLPDTGLITEAELKALPEGAVVITYGVAWAKIGPDLWRCPFREHVADRSVSDRWRGRFDWHDEKSSEWLATVATMCVYNPNDWDL